MAPKMLRNFGLTTGTITAGLFGLFLPWLLERSYPLWPWLAAGFLWLSGITRPAMLGPVYRGWMKVGEILGWINTRVLLGLVFFVVLLPTGILMRLSGRDPMCRKFDAERSSYRIKSRVPGTKHVERPF